nr:hypothetical protein [uncultured Mediterranean phage uvMED]
MAYTTINKSTDYFNTKLYSGTGSSQNITGVGFQPDWTWVKSRTNAEAHVLRDAVRGNYRLNSATNGAQDDATSSISGFVSDGFTVATADAVNNSSQTYASWNWKAGGGQGSSNTDGSINTTYTSVNTTAGFSISTYTGTGSAATVGHGLGAAPQIVITKRTDSSSQWVMYNRNLGANKNLHLELTDAAASSSAVWNDTESTSTVFSIGGAGMVNTSGGTYVAYCFAEKTGYSKFGSYTGNGNADGTFVYTGFKPAFVIIKNSSNAHNWTMIDNKRLGYNDKNYILFPDLSNAEPTTSETDILSNGFKIRASANGVNQSGNTMIYMAFGQSLVGSNNVPCTAR